MKAALAALLALALTGCGTVPARYAEGAACTTALFLGPQVGFPIALACGLHEVQKEIATEEADTETPKVSPKDTPAKPKKKHKAKSAPPPEPEPEAVEEDDDEPPFSDGDDGKGNDEDGGVRV